MKMEEISNNNYIYNSLQPFITGNWALVGSNVNQI